MNYASIQMLVHEMEMMKKIIRTLADQVTDLRTEVTENKGHFKSITDHIVATFKKPY